MRIYLHTLLIILLSIVSLQAFARQGFDPWLTGPLLAPSGHTIPKGHINYEPYLFVTDIYGLYNNKWAIDSIPKTVITSPTAFVSVGLTNWMDVSLTLPYNFTKVKNKSSSGWGDTNITFGFQILKGTLTNDIPDLKLAIGETFPTGKYDNLDPDLLGADANGLGSYQTNIGTDFQKMFQLKNAKYIVTRLSLTYIIPVSTKVHGLNVYGGGIGTDGRVKPGNKFTTDLGLEYTLTQHWVPAMDIVFADGQSSNFTGNPGTDASGLPNIVGTPSNDQFSIAPALEYNFNANVGLIGGVWFSVAGRNIPSFVAGVVALDIYV